MKDILETQVINGWASEFVLDLLKDQSGKLVLDVSQVFVGGSAGLREVSCEDLSLLINGLQYFHAIMNIASRQSVHHVTAEIEQKIVDYYFKNVAIGQIESILGLAREVIIQVLERHGIALMNHQKWKG